MRFDNSFGNPPYQENDDGYGPSASPVYHKFIRFSSRISSRMILVVPSRWFAGGKGLDEFRKNMLSRKDIYSIDHFDDASYFFSDTQIKGGVCIIYIDKKHKGKTLFIGGGEKKLIDLSKYDVLVKNIKSYVIIDKVLKHMKQSLNKIYYSNSFTGISTNDERLEDQSGENKIKCYVSKNKGFEKWIDRRKLRKRNDTFWKVLTPEATKKGFETGFGNVFIAKPEETYSQTYIAFRVKNKDQAENLKHYLQLELIEYLLSIRKASHHINQQVLKWVPLVDLNKKWNDKDLYKRFGLNDEEIEKIKIKVK